MSSFIPRSSLEQSSDAIIICRCQNGHDQEIWQKGRIPDHEAGTSYLPVRSSNYLSVYDGRSCFWNSWFFRDWTYPLWRSASFFGDHESLLEKGCALLQWLWNDRSRTWRSCNAYQLHERKRYWGKTPFCRQANGLCEASHCKWKGRRCSKGRKRRTAYPLCGYVFRLLGWPEGDRTGITEWLDAFRRYCPAGWRRILLHCGP